MSPSPTAATRDWSEAETTTMTAHTTAVAPKNNHACPPNRPKAPPVFVVKRSRTTPGMTSTGGRPESLSSTTHFVTRSMA